MRRKSRTSVEASLGSLSTTEATTKDGGHGREKRRSILHISNLIRLVGFLVALYFVKHMAELALNQRKQKLAAAKLESETTHEPNNNEGLQQGDPERQDREDADEESEEGEPEEEDPRIQDSRRSSLEQSLSILSRYKSLCESNVAPLPVSKTEVLEEKNRPKTLWVPSYPGSLDDKYLSQWVSSMTVGLKAPVKAYYSQSETLHRCKSPITATALCTVVHPTVRMEPPPDASKFTSYFDPRIVFAIRNPISVIPAHHNAKAILHHKQVGQVPIAQWRSFRDEYLSSVLKEYLNQIRTWVLELPYYHVALFLPYERLVDPAHGPAVLKDLYEVLEQAGYPMNEQQKTHTDCLWYQTLAKRSVDPKTREYDFTTEYIPAYSPSQRDMIIDELSSFVKELGQAANAKKHIPLIQILKDYISDVRHNIVLEEGWKDSEL